MSEGYTIEDDDLAHKVLYVLAGGIYLRWAIFALPMIMYFEDLKRNFNSDRNLWERMRSVYLGYFNLGLRWYVQKIADGNWESIRISNPCFTLHKLLILMKQHDTSNFDNKSVCGVNEIMDKEVERMVTKAKAWLLNILHNMNSVLIHVEGEAGRYMLRVCNLRTMMSTYDFRTIWSNTIPNLTEWK